MPGNENFRKQTTWGGAAGIALLGFALVYRFFPGLIHVSPTTRTAPIPVHTSAPPPIGLRPVEAAPILMGPPRELAGTMEVIPEPPTEPEKPATANIAATLSKADAALAEGHLFEPDDANALALYQSVLAEDANNRRAKAGVAAVRDALVAAVTAALDQGDAKESERLLAGLERAEIDRQSFVELRERLKLLRQVTPLLATAADRLKQGRDLEPAGASAIDTYRQVLTLDPANLVARQGLEQIQRTVLDGALAAVARDDFAAADAILAKAEQIVPGSQQLLDTRTRTEGVRRQRAGTVLAQAQSALDSGSADLAEQLARQAQAISADLPGLDEFQEKIKNARLYASLRPGEVVTDPYLDRSGNAPPVVVVPTGRFLMGSPESEEGHRETEGPQREVVITSGFALGRTEVTVAEFREFVRAASYVTTAEKEGHSSVYDENSGRMADGAGITWQNDYRGKRAQDNLPVVHVSWADAVAYLEWLSARTGKRYRLPSEAEFEYALRAGSTTRFWWGDGNPPRPLANVTGAGDRSPAHRTWRKAFERYTDGFWGPGPVRSFAANPLGLFDMDGNVSEWVEDCWHENYIRAPRDSRAWVNPGCERHLVRGGSWGSDPDQVRSAFRLSALTITRSARVGFRVARDL
ncbi:SUMF1/EgtB/PvdO family nonheme iron enzyme [Tahibacter amnicola]|uniref:SUMF1/EgtB/PvdO family nonheme iron enzyme n=1 Tax=Tahibacter amnicola TaxID=2976241 RepID=A0ABY6BL87_9GAMM|nr:SUMF1/EgtB/PvdO family nonheme iron enzyme [Tahibacter amnicola]UXI69800.1 SUMF1/EgtB/PvdO family nonheme iron enzyme [Tahibacter amnicola]